MTPDELAEVHQIQRLKARYLRCLDQKRFDEVGECFTPDATAAYSGGGFSFSGRDDIVGFLVESMSDTQMLTSHRCTQPEIDVAPDGTTATGTWALDDVVVHQSFGVIIRGSAFYEDRYVKVDGRWLIAHTGYKRTYETMEPIGAEVKVTASLFDTDGRSELAG